MVECARLEIVYTGNRIKGSNPFVSARNKNIQLVFIMSFKKTRRVVITGSGPSLAKISYDRFPNGAQIWRTNDFFKEPEFFVGQRVDAVFNGGTIPDIQVRIRRIIELNQNGTYAVNLDNLYADKKVDSFETVKQHFEYIECLGQKHAPELVSFIKYNDKMLDAHLFSGVAAIVVAILSGFDEIYLAGIDCDYETGPRYVYSPDKTEPQTLKWIHSYHPTALQWETIKKFQNKFKVKIFTLSAESPAAKLFPMAPIQKRPPTYL